MLPNRNVIGISMFWNLRCATHTRTYPQPSARPVDNHEITKKNHSLRGQTTNLAMLAASMSPVSSAGTIAEE